MKKITLLFFFTVIFGNVLAQNVEVTERLQKRMQSLNPIEYTRVLILLRDRVDIEALDSYLYKINAPIDYRAETVITTLRQKAELTQGPVLQYLNSQKSEGKVKQTSTAQGRAAKVLPSFLQFLCLHCYIVIFSTYLT